MKSAGTIKGKGKFVISLDFELLWGVRDIDSILPAYNKNILGVWDALPKILDFFVKHKIHGSFATVGFLFAKNKHELVQFCPEIKPNYRNKNLSPYNGHFDLIRTEEDNKLHFAPALIDLIIKTEGQEIGTHTFSHYYCLEAGQTKEQFEEDIRAAINIAKTKGIQLKSIVFPRNQFNNEYLEIIKRLGITSYRGNEPLWFHKAASSNKNELFKRIFRLIDSYINISGHHCSPLPHATNKRHPVNIPASRFLRPCSIRLKALEGLRLNRIKKSMTFAAKNDLVFHLWWHPHNFGDNQKENFHFLENILTHFDSLREKYNFQSVSMNELSNLTSENE